MKFFKLTKNPSTLSDNFKVGDKVFFDTFYEFQEDDLGFNYDRGILKEIRHWPSNNREYYIIQTDDGKLLQVGNVFHTEEEKDAFTNNWMNPKFEKESAITQPNKPKPTTMLPDNMQWAWDPDAADWVAVLKDNTNTTPPLYDPNNQNVVNNTTTYMSNIKSASVIDGDEDEDPLWVRLNDLFLSDGSLVDSYIKNEINCDDILNALNIEIKNKREYKKVCNYIKEFIEDNYMGTIKSATLEITDKNGKSAEEGMWLYKPMNHSTFRGDIPVRLFQVKIRRQKDGNNKLYLLSENKLITKGISHVKDGILFDTYEEAKQYSESHKTKEEKEFDKLNDWQKTDYYLSKQSSKSENIDDGKYALITVTNPGYDLIDITYYNDYDEAKEIQDSKFEQDHKNLELTFLAEVKDGKFYSIDDDSVYLIKDNELIIHNPQDSIKSACLSKFLDGPRYSKEIKIEAGLIKEGLVKYAGFDFNRGTKYAITTKGLEVLRKASEAEHNEALNEREKLAYMFGFNTDEVSTLDTTGKVIKSEEITDEQLEESWNKYYPLYRKDIEEEKMTEENYPADDEVAQKLKTTLSMYLYELKRYRKAIPIMKYHTNAKMKRAVEDGHSKGLSEDEITKQVDDIAEEYYKKENKIKPTFNSLSEDYLKSFLLGMIKNNKTASLNKFAKKWTICEADGTELGEVEADSELDAKVKFGIEHPEYADSQSIYAKEIKAGNKPFESTMGFYTYEVLWQDNDDKEGEFIEPIKFELCDDRDIDEWSWKCEELFGKEWFYGFLSKKDAMDKVIKELNKWGTIKGEIKQVDSLYTGRLKRLHSNYEQTTNTKEPYPNPSETPHDDIVLENHDGWVNTAAEYNYTPEQKRLLPLFKLVNEYVINKKIQLTEDVQNEENTIATGQAEVINELEHKVKDLGFYCEPIVEITDNDGIGQDIYSLKIFTK